MLGFMFDFLNEFREFHGKAAVDAVGPLDIKAPAIRGDNQANKIFVTPESIFVSYQGTDFHPLITSKWEPSRLISLPGEGPPAI